MAGAWEFDESVVTFIEESGDIDTELNDEDFDFDDAIDAVRNPAGGDSSVTGSNRHFIETFRSYFAAGVERSMLSSRKIFSDSEKRKSVQTASSPPERLSVGSKLLGVAIEVCLDIPTEAVRLIFDRARECVGELQRDVDV
ncbi:hypothetical protein Bca52824_026870 [Brassica carinata]|uniref:Uncharacterized protein n=1 Tax=Brassica carinata TaxID=52824 RepID=A0A8X7SJB0_BRACI|nr:hypothetical protein Bca52824_026870 [Brassica carinata]